MTQTITVHGTIPATMEDSLQKQGGGASSLQCLHQNVLLLNGRLDQRCEIEELLKKRLGYQVLDSGGMPDQLNDTQLRMLKPDAVIIDVASLPHSRQLVTALTVLLPYTAIIILVGYGEYQEAHEYLMLGAHDFITKPFAQERIGLTLRNAIALQGARREVRDMLRLIQPSQKENGEGAGEKTGAVSCGSIISLLAASGDIRKLHDIENAVIRFTITFYNGRISTVSRKLGVGRSTLYRKLASLERP